MDIYVIMQVLILFGAIFLGVRLGGMGIGYAGGLGVVLLNARRHQSAQRGS